MFTQLSNPKPSPARAKALQPCAAAGFCPYGPHDLSTPSQSSTCIALPFTCQSQRNGSRRWKWKCSCLALLQLASYLCPHLRYEYTTTERLPFPDLCFLHTLFRGPVSTHRFFYRRNIGPNSASLLRFL